MSRNPLTSKSAMAPPLAVWIGLHSVTVIEGLFGVDLPADVAQELASVITMLLVYVTAVVVRRITHEPAAFSAPLIRKKEAEDEDA